MDKTKTVNTVGKRKTAIARATLVKGTGKVTINKVALDNVKPELAKLKMMEPLAIAGAKAKQVDIDVTSNGGGMFGQADAIRQSIARALIEYTGDKELQKAIITYDRTMVSYDPRRTEPHKFGRSKQGARRARQLSKR